MTRELFEVALKLLEEKKYPFYIAFSQNIWGRGAKKNFIANVRVFCDEIRLDKDDAEEFYEFLYNKINARQNAFLLSADEKKKIILQSWTYPDPNKDEIIEILVEEWESTTQLLEFLKKTYYHTNFLDDGLRNLTFIILRFGIRDLVVFLERYPDAGLPIINYGFPRFKHLIVDRKDFLSVADALFKLAQRLPTELVRPFFEYLIEIVADDIRTKEDLMQEPLRLAKIVENFDYDPSDFYSAHSVPYATDSPKKLRTIVVRFGLEHFIKIAQKCPKDKVKDFLLFGLPACIQLITEKESFDRIADLLIKFCKSTPKEHLKMAYYQLVNFEKLVGTEDDLRIILDILAQLIGDCPKELVSEFLGHPLDRARGAIHTKDDLSSMGKLLILLTQKIPKDQITNFFVVGSWEVCERLASRFGWNEIIKIVEECTNNESRYVFAYGLKAYESLIGTQEDLLAAGMILVSLVKKSHRSRDSIFHQVWGGFCKNIIKDIEDLRTVSDMLIALVDVCLPEKAGVVFSSLQRLHRKNQSFPDDKEVLQRIIRMITKDRGVNSAFVIDVFFPFFIRDPKSSAATRSTTHSLDDIEAFILRLTSSADELQHIQFMPTQKIDEFVQHLDVQGLLWYLQSIKQDIRYFTCDGLAELGFLSCHVTNAFGGGAALGKDETQRSEPFENIVSCIENQGENKFQLSFSTLSPNTSNSIAVTRRYGINGAIGVFFDSGYVYESYSQDAWTHTGIKSTVGSYRTGEKTRRVDSYVATNFGDSRNYNELLARRWTIGGLFYTKGVQDEVVGKLKEIADAHSYRLYPNPAYISRKVAFGIPKEVEKVYPVYEINLDTHMWKIVYKPMKRDTVEEFKELIETATADTCRELSKKKGISKFIPEWDRFTSDKTGWQHTFHDFRLDEHTIKLFEYFDRSDEFKRLQDREQRVLRLTALLHDIAKDGGALHARPRPDPDHPEKSAQVVLDILQRLKYDSRTLKIVYRLVYFYTALGNIVIFGDKDASPVTPERHKVKHSMYDLTKVFFKDEIPLLKILTKADIYALKKNGALLKSDHNFLTLKTRSSIKTEDAIDICAQQIIEWQTTGTMPVEEYRQAT